MCRLRCTIVEKLNVADQANRAALLHRKAYAACLGSHSLAGHSSRKKTLRMDLPCTLRVVLGNRHHRPFGRHSVILSARSRDFE